MIHERDAHITNVENRVNLIESLLKVKYCVCVKPEDLQKIVEDIGNKVNHKSESTATIAEIYKLHRNAPGREQNRT